MAPTVNKQINSICWLTDFLIYDMTVAFPTQDFTILELTFSGLQIRRDNRDNLGIIFHITPLKCMLRSIIRTVLL